MKRLVLILLSGVTAWSASTADHSIAQQIDSSSNSISFEHDVQPILRRNCFRCHGTKNQEASLQLNVRESAFGEADSGEPVIVKHDSEASLLIKRIVNDENGDVMPPDAKPLSQEELSVLRTWIDQGAQWPDEFAKDEHWAYQQIKRPDVPKTRDTGTAVDQFIYRGLQRQGLQPSPTLDRPRLIRRVSLALTGVAPSPTEVREFVHDDSPKAYEKRIDRLLDSSRFGERWAVPWLDSARYADSNGYQADQIRDNWAYRDWVIRAFNDGMPMDQFVTDQIAGDLHPNATPEQKIATGFHRMTLCNVEAGVHPEANRVNQIVDRVNTTATVFLGTTLECAQCHDHKYDPFSQKDYYRLFAYFNNTPMEVKNTSGVTWDFYGPTMDLPMTESKSRQYGVLQDKIAKAKAKRKTIIKNQNKDFTAWLAELKKAATDGAEWQTVKPEFASNGGEDFEIQDDGAVLLSGKVPDKVKYTFTIDAPTEPLTAIRIDALTDDAIPGKGPGRGDPVKSNIILSEFNCKVENDKESSPVKIRQAFADYSQPNWPVANALDGNLKTGWAIGGQFGKPHWAAFVLDKAVSLDPFSERLVITLDQNFGSGRVIGKPRVSLFFGKPEFIGLDEKLLAIAVKPKPTSADRKKLRAEFNLRNPKLTSIDAEIQSLEKQANDIKPDTTLVMTELDKPRETFVMVRGDYENVADKVQAQPPSILQMEESTESSATRMDLAKWMTSPKNPLLARVMVNRWWSEIYGTGIVSTPEDFGTQGESPSHPELLDYLASELIDSGWSMKHVLKQMVLCKTFQQSARITDELRQADPNNRLLARGPRFRMNAEVIRDNALSICGLLSSKMFGPPIMPYQPDNLWRSVGRNQPKWIAATNEDRFRRGVYVIWKRAAPYPSFINFDAPDRGSCTVNRSRSNTPLQALTLLNDPAYAEMALSMADRVLQEVDNNDEVRLDYAIQLALSRNATSREIQILQKLLNEERKAVAAPQTYSQRTKPPFKQMVLKTEDKKELAAWFAVTNAILNLDETMTQ